MARHEITIELDATPDDVYEVIADVGAWDRWDPSIRSIEVLDAPADASAGRFAVTVGFYGKAIDQIHEVVEAMPSSRFVVESSGRATGRWEFTLEPTEGGTRVLWVTSLKLGGLARLLDKGLDLALAGLVENAVDGLRRQVETSNAA